MENYYLSFTTNIKQQNQQNKEKLKRKGGIKSLWLHLHTTMLQSDVQCSDNIPAEQRLRCVSWNLSEAVAAFQVACDPDGGKSLLFTSRREAVEAQTSQLVSVQALIFVQTYPEGELWKKTTSVKLPGWFLLHLTKRHLLLFSSET